MSGFVVHSIPGSPYGRAVLVTLYEKGIDFRFIPVSPATMKSEPHLSRHAFGRVPVIEHDGFALYETQAIMRYLDRLRAAPALVPKDAQAAARMDQLISICDWYLFQGVNNVIGFHRVVGPKLMGLTPDEDAIAAAMPKAQTVMAELSRLLGDKPYFAADTLTSGRSDDRAAARLPGRNAGMGRPDSEPPQPAGLACTHARPRKHAGHDLGTRRRHGKGGVRKRPCKMPMLPRAG